MKRTNQTCFYELSIAKLASPNAKSLCANNSSTHDSKIKETYSNETYSIYNIPQKAFSNIIPKLNSQARARLTSPASSLMNIFTNMFHVKQSPQRAQSFTWNIHNILSYV